MPLLKTHWSKTEPTEDEFWIIVIGLARLEATDPDVVARAVGLRNTEDLAQNLSLDRNSWVTYWRGREPLSYVAAKTLDELWSRNRAKQFESAASLDTGLSEPIDEYSPAANILYSTLHMLKMLYESTKDEPSVIALVDPILHNLQSGNPELQKRGQ